MDFLRQADNNRKDWGGVLQWAHYDNNRMLWMATDGARVHYTSRKLEVEGETFPLHEGAVLGAETYKSIPLVSSAFNTNHLYSVQLQASELRWALTYITGEEVILTVAHNGDSGILVVESESFKIPLSLNINSRAITKSYNWRVSVNPDYMRQALRYMQDTIHLDYNSVYPKTGILHIGNHTTENYAGIMRLVPEHDDLTPLEHYEVMQLQPLKPTDNLIQSLIF